MANDNGTTPAAENNMSPGKGLLVLAGLVVLIAAYLWIVHLAGNTAGYAGFVFLLYWAGVEHMNLQRFFPVLIGSLFGLAVAFGMHALPEALGPTMGYSIMLTLLLGMIYCQVMGWATSVINLATMLFLTVGTIPAVHAASHYDHMAIAVLLAAAFFGGLVFLFSKLNRPKDTAAISTAN